MVDIIFMLDGRIIAADTVIDRIFIDLFQSLATDLALWVIDGPVKGEVILDAKHPKICQSILDLRSFIEADTAIDHIRDASRGQSLFHAAGKIVGPIKDRIVPVFISLLNVIQDPFLDIVGFIFFIDEARMNDLGA